MTALRRLGPRTLLYAGLFVLSGACALTYEVVWSRMLAIVFGVSAFAVSTVLVSYMGGMALGAAILGPRSERVARPLRLFAILEGSIGLYALAFPYLLSATDAAYLAVFPAMPDSFLLRSMVRFVLCVTLLLAPTICMGATLPALGQGLLKRGENLGFGVGVLYFVNTIGAAFGCWFAGFHLLPALGLQASSWLAAVGNAAIALTAWWLDRAPGAAPAQVVHREAENEEAAARPSWWPLAVACGSGFAALAFEVAWFRLLILVFGSTVYSFSAMLTVFLGGLAVGSLIIGLRADLVRRPLIALAGVQGVAAVATLAGCLAVNRMPGWFLTWLVHFGMDFEGMTRTKLVLSAAVLFPAALAFGGTFPLVVRLARTAGGGVGARIGRAYAWNTIGAIAGSFVTGFVLLPSIGMEWTLKLVVALAALLAVGSVFADRDPVPVRWKTLGVVAAAGLIIVALVGPRWNHRLLGAGVYYEPQNFLDAKGRPALHSVIADYELMTYDEGYNETIISYQSPYSRFITINGSTTASSHFEDMFCQRMLAHLPMALHETPARKACIVCLGAGVTTGTIGTYGLDDLVAVELERGVLPAARFFAPENHDVLDNPAFRLVIDDGRNFLRLTDERFDVISSQPNFPSLTGSGSLYTTDFFSLCRAKLAANGTMCQFLPIWRLQPSDVKTIYASFAHVFPHVRTFSTGLSLLLIGRNEPFPPVDLDALYGRVAKPEVAASLSDVGVRGPLEVLSYYQFDETESAAFAGDAPLNTDDKPRTEFFAPRSLFAHTVGANLAEVARVRPSREERARRLGLEGEARDSYLKLAAAYDAVTEAEVKLLAGSADEAIAMLIPIADSGHAYARYLVAERAEKDGLSLQSQGRIGEARAKFELALRYGPDRLEALAGVGYLDIFEGRLDRAEQLLSRAVELYPRSAGALYRLGAVKQAKGSATEAEELYRRAIARDPELAPPRGLLGGLLLARGDARGALEQFDIAVALGDDTEGVIAGRAEARRRLSAP